MLDSLRAGVDIVTYSGDKLLGGPQAGVISGAPKLVARMRSNSLFRALRVDKLTYAALEATLLAYVRRDHDAIPAIRMMRAEQRGNRQAGRRIADNASLPEIKSGDHRRRVAARRRRGTIFRLADLLACINLAQGLVPTNFPQGCRDVRTADHCPRGRRPRSARLANRLPRTGFRNRNQSQPHRCLTQRIETACWHASTPSDTPLARSKT